MKTWTFSINSLPQYRYGTITAIEQPWWLALIEWLNDEVSHWVCKPLYCIKLPNWFPRQRDPDDVEKYTLREWYGDLGQVVWVFIFEPLFQWIDHHPERKEYDLEIGYDKVKELFYERSKSFFDDEARI